MGRQTRLRHLENKNLGHYIADDILPRFNLDRLHARQWHINAPLAQIGNVESPPGGNRAPNISLGTSFDQRGLRANLESNIRSVAAILKSVEYGGGLDITSMTLAISGQLSPFKRATGYAARRLVACWATVGGLLELAHTVLLARFSRAAVRTSVHPAAIGRAQSQAHLDMEVLHLFNTRAWHFTVLKICLLPAIALIWHSKNRQCQLLGQAFQILRADPPQNATVNVGPETLHRTCSGRLDKGSQHSSEHNTRPVFWRDSKDASFEDLLTRPLRFAVPLVCAGARKLCQLAAW